MDCEHLNRPDLVLQEIDVQGKKAIIIMVPVPQLRAYQKIQTRLVRELEKKFSGKHVVFIAQVCIFTRCSRCAFVVSKINLLLENSLMVDFALVSQSNSLVFMIQPTLLRAPQVILVHDFHS